MTGNWNQNRFSLNADAEAKYKSDSIFRALVDTFRYMLRAYQYTPSELRQASLLAATMHEYESIKPLYVWMDEAKGLDMFGGAPKTATGSNLGAPERRKTTRRVTPFADAISGRAKNPRGMFTRDLNKEGRRKDDNEHKRP